MTHTLKSVRKSHFALILSTLILFVAVALHAQTPNSVLTGTILDVQGKGVVNATVTIRNEATGASKILNTDANGHYSADALAAGSYTVDANASGFGTSIRSGIALAAAQIQYVQLTLTVSAVTTQVTVNAGVDSIAAQVALSGGFIEERSPQSLISNNYIENFTSPVADYGEIVQIVPGAFSLSADGVGLGQSKTYFRGFPDGDYDIDFDGIPFYDTNSPTHHSWAFFPSQWVGGVDFDRSPGSASTVGPTPFGGSIHLLSKPLTSEFDVRGAVSYGTWNTKLYDGAFNSGSFGLFGGAKKSNLFIDGHHMSSDGYQTFNFNSRNAGSLLYQYQFSPNTVLTGFSGVVQLNSNAPGLNQTRCQAYGPSAADAANTYTCSGATAPFAGAGIKFLLTNNSDPINWLDYQYNTYHVPTDFEYVSLKSELGKGWYLEVKPYTYNYDNAELFSNATPITEASTINGSTTYNGVKIAPCNVQVSGILPCGVDKYNSYRKYGETLVVTQTSKLGILRTGLWYEWARTDRHQYPSDPLSNWADQALPNFAEQFWTKSYQPYVEYEFHVAPQFNITAGTKFAAYTFDILHHSDDGKTVGNLCPLGQTTGCPGTVSDTGRFIAWLPSLDANYRIQPNWSVYGQVATGSIVPPSNVYDYNHTPSASVPTPGLLTPPKQQKSTTYQIGSVYKGQNITLDADAYRIRFQNSYSSTIDNTTSETVFYLQPSSITQGVEFETTYASHGFNLYLNGSASNAVYSGSLNAGTAAAPYYQKTPGGLWVSQTPTDTEFQGLTYAKRGLDLGFFNKRVGEQHVDNKAYHNQAVIAPFSTVNTFVNYTIRNRSIFDQTKIRLSANNLLDAHNLQSLTLATKASPASFLGTNGTTYTDQFAATTGFSNAGADSTGIMSGRSFSVSITFGFAPFGR